MTTLLQTRVDHRVAAGFKRAARLRGKTPYAYLQQIVREAADMSKPGTWDEHWQRLAQLKLKHISHNVVVRMREESEEQ